jgi:hypothetical protein
MKFYFKLYSLFILIISHQIVICLSNSCDDDIHQADDESNNWQSKSFSDLTFSNDCNIDKINFDDINESQFMNEFKNKPVVLLMNKDRQSNFKSLVSKNKIIESHGKLVVTLSSSNSYSYEKRKGKIEDEGDAS